MLGLEQQHHFLRLMELTSPPVPEREVKAQVETQIRSQTHPAEGEGDSGKLASELSRKRTINSTTVCVSYST